MGDGDHKNPMVDACRLSHEYHHVEMQGSRNTRNWGF